MQFIDKVGVEVEGGWNDGNLPSASPGGTVCSDGSLNFSSSDGFSITAREFVSNPFSNLVDLADWMRRIYPPHTNQTCGLHVHVSLKSPLNYARIIDQRFQKYFTQELGAWGDRANIKNKYFRMRLEGSHHFCKNEWKPEAQMKATGKDSNVRFCIWNFCWGVRKTAECRVLPTFKNPQVAVAAVMQVAKIVENYLKYSPILLAVEDIRMDDGSDMPQELIDLMKE